MAYGQFKKHFLKQKVTLQYMKQCRTINVLYARNSNCLSYQPTQGGEKGWLDMPLYLNTQFHTSVNKN